MSIFLSLKMDYNAVMKCHILQHFIKVFTVSKSTWLGVLSLQRVNICKGNAFVVTTVSQNKGNMIYCCCCFLNAVNQMGQHIWIQYLSHRWIVYSYFMPVCSIVKTITPRCRGRPSASCNSASGRPRYRGVIVWLYYKQAWNTCFLTQPFWWNT